MRSNIPIQRKNTSPCLRTARDYSDLVKSIEELRGQAARLFLEASYGGGLCDPFDASDLRKLIDKISVFEDLLEDR